MKIIDLMKKDFDLEWNIENIYNYKFIIKENIIPE